MHRYPEITRMYAVLIGAWDTCVLCKSDLIGKIADIRAPHARCENLFKPKNQANSHIFVDRTAFFL
jgi:hypothetical protein